MDENKMKALDGVMASIEKQYGKGAIFKTLKVNYRQSIPSLRINEKKIDRDTFLAKNPDYSAAPIDNMVVFQGRGSPKQLPEYDTHDIFFMKMATKYVIDSLELDPLKGVGIFSEVPNNIYLDLLTRFDKNIKLDYVINHTTCFIETKKTLEQMGELPHTFLYESAASGLITCLSNKTHTFIFVINIFIDSTKNKLIFISNCCRYIVSLC